MKDIISTLHGIRSESDNKYDTYKSMFFLLCFITLLDGILLIAVGDKVMFYSVAYLGLYVLIGLTAMCAIIFFKEMRYRDNVDEFYLEAEYKLKKEEEKSERKG